VIRRNDATAQAATALNRLVLERVVVSYTIGFEVGRVVVTARILAQDDLSRARAKRRVQAALDPVAPGVTVIIEAGAPVVQGRR
jgi:hypothetical protein